MKLSDITESLSGEKPEKGQVWTFKEDKKLKVLIKDVVGNTVVYHTASLKKPSPSKILRVVIKEFKYMYELPK